MADPDASPTPDDGLTQRERRAQRVRKERRGGSSGPAVPLGERAQKWVWPGIIGVLVVAGIGFIAYSNLNPQECPDHWHATFVIYVQDAEGQPKLIDYAKPMNTQFGKPYYDFSTNKDMSLAVHMHQDQSSPETGDATVASSQFHYEGGSKCVGIQNSLHAVDTEVDADSIALEGPLATSNPGGPWQADGAKPMRFFLETRGGDEKWGWSEHDFGDYLHYQLGDGEAMLLVLGDFTDAQIHEMQDKVPNPISRSPREGDRPRDAPTPTATATGTATATDTPTMTDTATGTATGA